MERTCKIGSEDIFRCKNYSKSGYIKCKMQVKVIFPGYDNSAKLFLSNDSHTHECSSRNNENDKSTKFT